MRKKKVDCIILTILQEERENLLKNNDKFIVYPTEMKDGVNYTEFVFLDRNCDVRTGVICDFGKLMGITNAIKLFFLVSQKYESLLYINAGVAAGVSGFHIGDVFCVTELQTICENNDTSIDDFQFKGADDISIDHYQGIINSNVIKKSSEAAIVEIIAAAQEKEYFQIIDLFKHKFNKVVSGKCVTTSSVIKDDVTKAELKKIRKLNVIEMEAYYFHDWFKLYQRLGLVEKKAKVLVFKVPSDSGEKREKAMLEEVGARELAMNNLYMVISHLLCSEYRFESVGRDSIDYWNDCIFKDYVDKCAQKENSIVLSDYFSRIIYNKEYVQVDFRTLCENVCKSGSITIIEGDAGTGKSTLLGLIFNELKAENNLLYIDLKHLISNSNYKVICNFLTRIVKEKENITLLIDSLVGDYEQQKNEPIMEVFLKIQEELNSFEDVNVSVCIGSDISDNKWTKSRVYERDLTANKSNVCKVYLLKEAYYSNSLKDIITKFAQFYYSDKEKAADFVEIIEEYVKKHNISFIDFRMLKMFADKLELVKSKNFFDFIHAYVLPNRRRALISAIHNGKDYNPNDKEYELMYKNIYTRSYIMAYAIFDKIKKGDKQYFSENVLIFSDNINYFFSALVGENIKCCLEFCASIQSDDKCSDYLLAIKTQILYALSNVTDNKNRSEVLRMLDDEFDAARQRIKTDKTSQSFVIFRTTGIALAKVRQDSEPINIINDVICKNKELRKYNLFFHFLYYSQQEFSYNDINAEIGNVNFETIVITYNTLMRQLKSSGLLKYHIFLTLVSLIEFSKDIKHFPGSNKDELINSVRTFMQEETIEDKKILAYAEEYVD
ncbi:MAG: hypothetical protein Q4C52_05165 [Eubacteriales bacterium]|nr:hypothetical protein [Eubacteriales bacterium]